MHRHRNRLVKVKLHEEEQEKRKRPFPDDVTLLQKRFGKPKKKNRTWELAYGGKRFISSTKKKVLQSIAAVNGYTLK